MSLAAANGQSVACVTATKGEAGVQDESRWPAARLSDIRSQEMAKGLEILGISNHQWLGYPDGACMEVSEDEAVARIIDIIEQYQTDSIITFAPDGLTGHPDHRAVSRWARKAAEKSDLRPVVYYGVHTTEAYEAHLKSADEQFNIYFAIDEPTLIPAKECSIHVDLPTEVIDKKIQVFKAMPSQYAAWTDGLNPEQLKGLLASESLVKADDSRWADL